MGWRQSMTRKETDMEYLLLGSRPFLIKEVHDSVPIVSEHPD